MTNIVRLFEAVSGIKADKYKALSDMESAFDAVLDKDLKELYEFEIDAENLRKSIVNASKLSHRMDFERELNKVYKAYSLALAKAAVRVDKHFNDRELAIKGL